MTSIITASLAIATVILGIVVYWASVGNVEWFL